MPGGVLGCLWVCSALLMLGMWLLTWGLWLMVLMCWVRVLVGFVIVVGFRGGLVGGVLATASSVLNV